MIVDVVVADGDSFHSVCDRDGRGLMATRYALSGNIILFDSTSLHHVNCALEIGSGWDGARMEQGWSERRMGSRWGGSG